MLPRSDEYAAIQRSTEPTFEATWTEGFVASIQDGFMASIGVTAYRGAKGIFDNSAKIDWQQANKDYFLEGTEAAYKEGDEPTISAAKDRLENLREQELRNIIIEGSNIGGMGKFVGGVVGNMMDPLTLVGNIGVGKALAYTGKALAGSMMASSKVGTGLARMYADDISRSFLDVMKREAVESVVSSGIEEGVQLSGIGEYRRPRDYTKEEAFTNFLVGTLAGTVLGTAADRVMSGNVKKQWERKFGSNAKEIAEQDAIVNKIESDSELAPSEAAVRVAEFDTFDAKPHHEEVHVPVEDAAPTKAFIPLKSKEVVDVDSAAAGRGQISMTDNVNHAMNVGDEFIEVDLSGMKLVNDNELAANPQLRREFIWQVYNKMAQGVDSLQQFETLQALFGDIFIEKGGKPTLFEVVEGDIDVKTGKAQRLGSSDIVDAVHKAFEGKKLDEVRDIFNRMIDDFNNAKLADADTNGTKAFLKDEFEEALEGFFYSKGYDGFSYRVRRTDGKLSHYHHNVFNGSKAKVDTSKVRSTPVKTAMHQAQIDDARTKFLGSLAKEIQSKNVVEGMNEEFVGNGLRKLYEDSPEAKAVIDSHLAKLAETEGEESAAIEKTMRELLEADNIDDVVDAADKDINAFISCILGG